MNRADVEQSIGVPDLPAYGLEHIDISQELATRAIRSLNRKGESDGMYALAVAVGECSISVLKRLAVLAIELCDAGTGGVSVIEEAATGAVFRWRALAGELERFEGGTTPRDWSPCGECLKAGRAALYSYPARHFTYFQQIDVPIGEGLVLPMYDRLSPLGTIWIVIQGAVFGYDGTVYQHSRKDFEHGVVNAVFVVEWLVARNAPSRSGALLSTKVSCLPIRVRS